MHFNNLLVILQSSINIILCKNTFYWLQVGDTKWYLTAPYTIPYPEFHEKIRPIPNGRADPHARFSSEYDKLDVLFSITQDVSNKYLFYDYKIIFIYDTDAKYF